MLPSTSSSPNESPSAEPPEPAPTSTEDSSGLSPDNPSDFQTFPLPAFKATIAWRLLEVNQAWEVLTGSTRSQAVGSSLFEWVQPVDIVRLQRFSEKPVLAESRNAPRWDVALKRGTGWAWVDLAARWNPGLPGQDAHFVCVLTDVTARRLQEEQLRTALERERRLHQNMSSFVAMVSHELRLPLANIGYAT